MSSSFAHVFDVPLFLYTFVCLYVCFPHSSVCLIVDHAPVTFGHLTHLEFCAVRDTDAEADRTITCSIILTASVVFSHRLVIAYDSLLHVIR
jgi:hypothetical protein